MEDIYVNDILAALQEMKEETNSNEDDVTLGWAITAIEHSIKMQDEIDALKSELKQLEKSDASKEQSSIDYYSLYRELKAENKVLKERLEKAEAKLFMTVRNNIVGKAVGDTDVIALMIIRNFDEMIDFEKAIKSKAEAEARLKELKGEKQ